MIVALLIKTVLLAGPPLATLIGIHKARTFWPLAFITFIGTTITVIDLRMAEQLSVLQQKQAATTAAPLLQEGAIPLAEISPLGSYYTLASWLLAALLLFLGIRKIKKALKQQAISELLQEE